MEAREPSPQQPRPVEAVAAYLARRGITVYDRIDYGRMSADLGQTRQVLYDCVKTLRLAQAGRKVGLPKASEVLDRAAVQRRIDEMKAEVYPIPAAPAEKPPPTPADLCRAYLREWRAMRRQKRGSR